MEYLKNFWKDPLNIEGKCSQKDFANIYLLSFIIGWIPFIGQIYGLVFIIPFFCLATRRFHDLGLSGTYLITLFIPIVNLIMLLYLLFTPGKKEENPISPYSMYNINSTIQYDHHNNVTQTEKNFVDNLYENTLNLYKKTTTSESTPQNKIVDKKETINIHTPSQDVQSFKNIQTISTTPKSTNTYKEENSINTISKFSERNILSTNTKNNNINNSLSPEESNTKLILCSLIFCILSLLLFNWPGSIGLEWISIICGSIPIYSTYKESHSLPIVPFGCIVVSLFLFLISLYLI